MTSDTVTLEDLVLMPETQARKALAGKSLRLRVLAPLGPFAGRGVMRVLRCRPSTGSEVNSEKEFIELVCGYESYVSL